ncbi:MAG: hypothetical protein LKF36_01110 [Lactobacillus sp.]|jgi:hypothetical protein|nr:hypothetical protein [Lactobacillus sp.]
MRKKFISFILLATSVLLFALIPAKPVLADDEVVIPVRDSSFLTLNDPNYRDFLSKGVGFFNSNPIADSYVPGLSTWKLSKLYTGSWGGGEADPWYRFAREIYEVGPDMFLTDYQAIVIPANKITFKEIGVYRGKDFNDDSPWKMIFHSYYIVTVKNNGPVTLWQSPAYQTPVQQVNPGDTFTINQAYFSYDSGLWFDIGANQWIPAYYLDNTLVENL